MIARLVDDRATEYSGVVRPVVTAAYGSRVRAALRTSINGPLLLSDSLGKHEREDTLCPCRTKRCGARVEGRTGGSHVIDEKHPRSDHRGATTIARYEGVANVEQTFGAIEDRLLRRIVHSTEGAGVELDTERSGDRPGEEHRLIVAALGEPLRMERHRHHDVHASS
jgi:hypothetical protein